MFHFVATIEVVDSIIGTCGLLGGGGGGQLLSDFRRELMECEALGRHLLATMAETSLLARHYQDAHLHHQFFVNAMAGHPAAQAELFHQSYRYDVCDEGVHMPLSAAAHSASSSTTASSRSDRRHHQHRQQQQYSQYQYRSDSDGSSMSNSSSGDEDSRGRLNTHSPSSSTRSSTSSKSSHSSPRSDHRGPGERYAYEITDVGGGIRGGSVGGNSSRSSHSDSTGSDISSGSGGSARSGSGSGASSRSSGASSGEERSRGCRLPGLTMPRKKEKVTAAGNTTMGGVGGIAGFNGDWRDGGQHPGANSSRDGSEATRHAYDDEAARCNYNHSGVQERQLKYAPSHHRQ